MAKKIIVSRKIFSIQPICHVYRFGCCILFVVLVFWGCSSVANDKLSEGESTITLEQLRNSIEYAASPRITIEYCKEFLSNNPNNAEAHYIIAVAYREMATYVVEKEEEKKVFLELSVEHFDQAKSLGYVPAVPPEGNP